MNAPMPPAAPTASSNVGRLRSVAVTPRRENPVEDSGPGSTLRTATSHNVVAVIVTLLKATSAPCQPRASAILGAINIENITPKL